MNEDTVAVYRVRVVRHYPANKWREEAYIAKPEYNGPYDTLAAARRQAAYVKRYSPQTETDIEFARTEWEPVE